MLVFGTLNNDPNLVGSDGNDDIYAASGHDTLYGEAGNDRLYGGDGNDQLIGADGNDTLYGGLGNDSLYGNAGNDSLYGGAGDDTLMGVNGTNTLYGEDGNDSLVGGLGNDTLRGDAGTDTLLGGAGNDRIIVWGTFAALYYSGTDAAGDDLLAGNGISHTAAGPESISGGSGNDTLEIYGTVDLSTSTFYNDIESLVVHSDITFDAATFAGLTLATLTGDSSSILRFSGEGQVDLTGVGVSHFAQLDVWEGVTVNLDADDLAEFDKITGDGRVYVDGELYRTAGETLDLPANPTLTGCEENAGAGTYLFDTVPNSSANVDYLLYRTSGALSFDQDGDGSATAVQLAELDNKPTLHAGVLNVG